MRKPTLRLTPSIVGLLLIVSQAGCGGGGGDGGATTQAEPVIGVFFDAPVGGLAYKTASRSGVTNERTGEFTYIPGEVVSFYFGDTHIGSSQGRPFVTPFDLYSARGHADRSINIIKLLLAADSSPGYSILNIETAAQKFVQDQLVIDLDLPTDQFFSQPGVAAAIERNYISALPTTSEAIGHFSGSVEVKFGYQANAPQSAAGPGFIGKFGDFEVFELISEMPESGIQIVGYTELLHTLIEDSAGSLATPWADFSSTVVRMLQAWGKLPAVTAFYQTADRKPMSGIASNSNAVRPIILLQTADNSVTTNPDSVGIQIEATTAGIRDASGFVHEEDIPAVKLSYGDIFGFLPPTTLPAYAGAMLSTGNLGRLKPNRIYLLVPSGADFSGLHSLADNSGLVKTSAELVKSAGPDGLIRFMDGGRYFLWVNPGTNTPDVLALLALGGTQRMDVPDATMRIPESPQNLQVVASPGSAVISWNPVQGALSYDLHWQSGSQVHPFNTIADVSAPFRHEGLSNSLIYYYYVTARNSAGESVRSAIVQASPGGPPNLAFPTPSGWQAPVVLSKSAGTSVSDPDAYSNPVSKTGWLYYVDSPLYLDFAVTNTGGSPAIPFHTSFSLSNRNSLETVWALSTSTSANLIPGANARLIDYQINLPIGSYVIEVRADYLKAVAEANESDNFALIYFDVIARPDAGTGEQSPPTAGGGSTEPPVGSTDDWETVCRIDSCSVPTAAQVNVLGTSPQTGAWDSCVWTVDSSFPSGAGYVGPSISWHSDSRETLKDRKCYDANHRLNGLQETWYPSGTLASQSTWLGGVLNGNATRWYGSGQISGIAPWRNGLTHGLVEEWHENGVKALEANLVDGKRHGLSREWDALGNLTKSCMYENDTVVSCE